MFGNLLNLLSLVALATAMFAPVADLDLTMYMGRWYQVYQNQVDIQFQGDKKCAITDYNLINSNISVLTSRIDKNGFIIQNKGYAFYKPNDSGGELTLKLNGLQPAPYWVLEVGPITTTIGPIRIQQYDYVIVSGINPISLFILCRDINRYYALYNDPIQENLLKYGFTNDLNKPLFMYHNDCDYTKYW